jgi:selenide,water dikinase
VVTTGLMRDEASKEEVEVATRSMMRLNREAAEIGREFGATAVTDVTGFGLLGHASEMAERGGVGFHFRFGALPWLPGAERLGEAWTYPGGAHDNRSFYGSSIRFDPSLEEWRQVLCFSPETSGGLLMALPPDRVQAAQRAAQEAGVSLPEIGSVVEEEGIGVSV